MKGVYSRLLIGLLSLLPVACWWDNTVYHCYQPVGDGWKQTDTLCFHPPRMERGGKYRMAVDVRHTGRYPYRSLWLLVGHNLTDSTETVTDTLECVLADRQGLPLGKGVASLYQLEIPYGIIEADGGGVPFVRVSHCMRGEPLEGISDIGIHLYGD